MSVADWAYGGTVRVETAEGVVEVPYRKGVRLLSLGLGTPVLDDEKPRKSRGGTKARPQSEKPSETPSEASETPASKSAASSDDGEMSSEKEPGSEESDPDAG